MPGPVTIGPVETPEPPPLVGLTTGDVGEIGTTVGRDVMPGDAGRVGVVGGSVSVGTTSVTRGRRGVVVVAEVGLLLVGAAPGRVRLVAFVGLVGLVGFVGSGRLASFVGLTRLAGLEGARFGPSGLFRSRRDLAMCLPSSGWQTITWSALPRPPRRRRARIAVVSRRGSRGRCSRRAGPAGQERHSEHEQQYGGRESTRLARGDQRHFLRFWARALAMDACSPMSILKALGPPESGHYVQDGRSVRLQPDLTTAPTITSPP
jgi:hypothetical protein